MGRGLVHGAEVAASAGSSLRFVFCGREVGIPHMMPGEGTGPAVSAVFTGNYQRQTAPSPQESSPTGGAAAKGTAGNAAVPGCSMTKEQRSCVRRRVARISLLM